MISAVYVVIIACASRSLVACACNCNAPESVNTECDTGSVYAKLEVAEELIRSAKEKICGSKDKQSSLPMDCEDLMNSGVKESGVYKVYPKNKLLSSSISVYCDMETDGGGWTVIQRRGDFNNERDYFNLDWNTYKKGFGNLKEEFWLGNDNIYALSNQEKYSIRFDLGAFDGSKAYAVYDNFLIDDESNNYRMRVSGYSGNAGDSFTIHSGYQFTTKDRDNDVDSGMNCAETWKGGWWFVNCHLSHLNGVRYERIPNKPWGGILWKTWKGNNESLKTTEMKIRKNRSG